MGKATNPRPKASAKARSAPAVVQVASDVEKAAAGIRAREFAEKRDAPLVDPMTAAHGHYEEAKMVDMSGELGGKPFSIAKVVRNRGGTTVERWHASGSLTQGQVEAISLYARSWRLWIGEQRVVANWSLAGSFRGMAADSWVSTKMNAKGILDEIDDLLRSVPPKYIDVWKNVVIFDEAAGVAGSRLGFKSDRAEASAKTVVLFIADMIAVRFRLG